jgi:hypothetical protein
MTSPTERAREAAPSGQKPQQGPRSGGSSSRAQPRPKGVAGGRARHADPQHDQLALERLEHLQQLEAFLGSALTHVMRVGFEGPLEWPALVQRPDGSRVQAPEEVVDRAAELIEGLCLTVDSEVRGALKLAPDIYRKKYRLLVRRHKDPPGNSRPHPDLTASPANVEQGGGNQ